MKNIKIIRNLVTDALILALILLFTFVPQIGYIQIIPGTLAITTVHLVVLIGASLFGWKRATLYGLFFGISSLIAAFTSASQFNMLFINPFVSILPRVLFGFISGIIIDLLKKHMTLKSFGILLPFLVAILTLIHTVLTLGCVYIFGILDIFKISKALGLEEFCNNVNQAGFIIMLDSATFIGALGEAAASFIIVPAAFFALRTIKFIKENDSSYKVKEIKESNEINNNTSAS